MKMTLVSSLALFCILSTAIGVKVEKTCPEDTIDIGDGACMYLHPVIDDSFERMKNLVNESDAWCKRQKVGNLRWRLPKIDTMKKRKLIGQKLVQYMAKYPPSKPIDQSDPPWIWLGLRRRRPLKKGERLSSESGWYWIQDRAILSIRTCFGDFWQRNQPGNEIGNEACAVAVIIENATSEMNKLQFADTVCAAPAPNRKKGGMYQRPDNLIALVCTADLSIKKRGPIEYEWWVYVVCVIIIFVPLSAVSVVAVKLVMHPTRKKIKKKRQAKQVDAKGTGIEPSGPKEGRKKKQKKSKKKKSKKKKRKSKKKNKEEQSVDADQTCSQVMSGDSTGSGLKVGYKPPFPDQASQMSPSRASNEEGGYSNVLPVHKQLAGKKGATFGIGGEIGKDAGSGISAPPSVDRGKSGISATSMDRVKSGKGASGQEAIGKSTKKP